MTPAVCVSRVRRSACSGSRGTPSPDRDPRRTHAAHRELPRPRAVLSRSAPESGPRSPTAEARRSGRRQREFESHRGHAPPQHPNTRSCRNWKTDRLEEPAAEGSTPSERTPHPHAVALRDTDSTVHGPEPYPDGREDVCKTSGQRFDSAPGLDFRMRGLARSVTNPGYRIVIRPDVDQPHASIGCAHVTG